MTARPTELVIPREGQGARLDRFLADALGVSRAEMQRWISEGRVRVGGTIRAADARLRQGEAVCIEELPPATSVLTPDPNVAFHVLHEDSELLVIVKPAGLVVHPARGHGAGTLVHGLLALGAFAAPLEPPTPASGEGRPSSPSNLRPGIVHRLDKGTSGVMVVARTARAREALKVQFQAHTIERMYEAIAVGEVSSKTIATLLGRHPRDRLRFTTRVAFGKRAVTHVRVVSALRGATHVECRLETGRTHQIRVHLADSGTPILGDVLYGKRPMDGRLAEIGERLGHQALHARVLGFRHPLTGETLRFEAPLPPDFQDALASLGA